MKKLMASKLALIFLLSSLSMLGPVALAQEENAACENAECVQKIVDKLEDLGAIYARECLPTDGTKTELKTYHEENGLTEQCWKLITQISELEDQLLKHQTNLEQQAGCENGDCKIPGTVIGIKDQLGIITKVEEDLSCTTPQKELIKDKCVDDMTCVLEASALGLSGHVAELLLPASAKPKDCDLGNDNCVTQLGNGFLKSLTSYLTGAWDLLKLAGQKSGQKLGEFWDWVRGAEDHSSTSQLALAKASEDPGVFDMLLKDFPGTMKKIWNALVASIKEWLKTDIFCQKWEGAPQFSTCLQPTESFDCLPCKSMITGLCAVSGTLLADIVPAFFTGGLVTAAKHGVNGSVKIAKLFKVSDATLKAIKNSKVAKLVESGATKVDDALKASSGIKAAKTAASSALNIISKYLLSPTRKVVKESLAVLTSAMSKGPVYVVVTATGKSIVAGARALKLTGKVVLYPIYNPLTVFAYRAGERSFEKVLTLGSPKLASTGVVTSTLVKSADEIETLLARIEEARFGTSNSSTILKLEQELLVKIRPKRRAILGKILHEKDVKFDEIIRNLYPELQYGEWAMKLSPQKMMAAEKELWSELSKMADGHTKNALIQKYNAHIRKH